MRLPQLEELDIYKKDHWLEQGRWLQPTIASSGFAQWHNACVVKEITGNTKLHTAFTIFGYGYLHKDDRAALESFLKETHSQNKLGELTDIIDTRSKEIFDKFSHFISLSDEEICPRINEIGDLFIEFTGIWSLDVYMSDIVTHLAIESGFIASESDLFALVHPHLRSTWIEEEAKTVITLARKKIAGENIDSEVEKYVADYAWLRMSKWIGEPMTKEFAEKRILEDVSNIEKNNHIATHHEKVVEKTLDGIVRFCIATAYWRAECAKLDSMLALRLRSILQSLAERVGKEYRFAAFLSVKELAKVVTNPELMTSYKETLEGREKEFACAVTPQGEEIILTPKDEAYRELKTLYLEQPVEQHTGTLKGVGASPGKVTGKVRVVNSSKEFPHFQEGEILVAPETSPSFVPLMRMAAAILTGRGGITSHAAIVSRELKKPCIIAIKDVTKILKDGDMVEVDAERGVVTLIQKND